MRKKTKKSIIRPALIPTKQIKWRKRTSKKRIVTFSESLGTFQRRVIITIVLLIANVFAQETKIGDMSEIR